MFSITTKEHLIYFMQNGTLRLSKYDLKFMNNLHLLAIQKKNITTNQVSLFDRLVDKYARQLAKHNIDKALIDSLPWESNIIASDKQYTEAYVNIENNKIIFKAPYNREFVKNFRDILGNSFVWLKEQRCYQSKLDTQALKDLVYTIHRYFPIVNYCPTSSRLLNNIRQYDSRYWNPTLVYKNSRYYIAAINQHLHLAIQDIELSNSVECLTTLAMHGIETDDSIINDDKLLSFASQYEVDLDYKDIDEIIGYLKAIDTKVVVMHHQAGMILQYRINLLEKFNSAGITVVDSGKFDLVQMVKDVEDKVAILLSSSTLDTLHSYKKIVRILNSLPIEIK